MSTSQSQVKPVLGPSEPILNLPPNTPATVRRVRDEKVRWSVEVIVPEVENPDPRPPRVLVETLPALPRR